VFSAAAFPGQPGQPICCDESDVPPVCLPRARTLSGPRSPCHNESREACRGWAWRSAQSPYRRRQAAFFTRVQRRVVGAVCGGRDFERKAIGR
jgi:hypothetical protein